MTESNGVAPPGPGLTCPMAECCGYCYYSRPDGSKGHDLSGDLECHRFPPEMGMVPVQVSGAVVGPGGPCQLKWLSITKWRSMKPKEWCGEFAWKPSVVN